MEISMIFEEGVPRITPESLEGVNGAQRMERATDVLLRGSCSPRRPR